MDVSAFFNTMQDISENMPIIKFLPEKLDHLAFKIKGLRDRVVKDYVTYDQITETLRAHQNSMY